MQSDVKGAETTRTTAEPPMFRTKIGSTVYRVSVHFSKTSAETVEDKILRLIKNECLVDKVPQGEPAAGKR